MARARKPVLRALVLLTLVGLAALAVVLWRDPYALIRGEFARQRVMAGLSTASVEADGHRWTYAWRDADTPDAPTIVMVHGFTGSQQNWYLLAKALGGRYRLLIPDLPGWGDSERKPGAVYGFSQQAQHVEAFIRALSPDKPVILLGHSMGGGIAALVAARYPAQIAGVGLLDAAGVRFKDNQFGVDVLAGKNPFGVHDEASLQRYIDIVFHDPKAKPWLPWPASRVMIDKRIADADFESGVLDRIGRSEEALLPGQAAANIHQPALLLWCRQDAVIDPSAQALYAQQIPQAQQVLLDGCGHMAQMERPREVADAVVKLVEST